MRKTVFTQIDEVKIYGNKNLAEAILKYSEVGYYVAVKPFVANNVLNIESAGYNVGIYKMETIDEVKADE